jgi:cellulose synthase/poly-beta-1,6-N-acetylglucosamine synthase-like glycosyltransferase
VAVLAEMTFGAIAHGATALAAGPFVAIALGAAVAATTRARAAQVDRTPSSAPTALPAANESPGLLGVTAVGVMAYNEAGSVEQCLRAVLDERDGDAKVPSVVVVVSGSMDGTDDICRKIASEDPRVRLVVEPVRSGKASAENIFLGMTDEPILALVGGDTLLAPHALTRIVNALADTGVGMAGGRIVPTNGRRGIANRLVDLMWSVHHEVAIRQPKLGEVAAFRRCFDHIDVASLVDEVTIERQVQEAGLVLRYVPDAFVYNRGPRTVRDYVRQRTRINRGHASTRAETGYAPSTMQTGNQVRAALHLLVRRPTIAPVMALGAMLEVLARVQARGRQTLSPTGVWAPITSAKGRIDLTDFAPQPAILAVKRSGRA